MSLNPIIKNTLDGMLSKGEGSSLVAPQRDWGIPKRHCDPGPCPEDKWPPRTPGPAPQGKWECKYVNEPKKTDWGGVFDSPVLY